jgi:hypothetical protein
VCLARLVRPELLVLHCRAHALLLTIAKVNIVTTSLKVTLRKLVMKHVISLAHLAISRVKDMIRMMRRWLETTAIGDGSVTEQQCSAGTQTHRWLFPKQITKTHSR